ncbi:patatin-like phospholipase family protein [Spongiimicrobium sp. 3-5]|uniref:patatin-like phospholipase family protein n=1 Tax=Spongiimicrobium sp. 3-5 TaxID=3332596 RepID=UPI003980597F
MSVETKKIGLVLSGGGYRAAAHAGAIKALEEHAIYPDMVSGTSAGALVGALYAAGYSPQEIVAVLKKIKLFSFSRYALGKPGFVDTDTFKEFLLEYLPDNDFQTLQKRLYITATDLVNGTAKIFTKGDLISAILASSAFPGVFTPVIIDNTLYSDGGIVDNFPVDPLKNKCDELYGVYVSPVKKMNMEEFRHSYNVVDRALHLKMHRNSVAKFPICNLVIYPDKLGDYGLFSPNHLDEIFEIGYSATKMELEKWYAEMAFLKH